MAVPDGQEPAGDYGPLEAIARYRVNLKRIETQRTAFVLSAGDRVSLPAVVPRWLSRRERKL